MLYDNTLTGRLLDGIAKYELRQSASNVKLKPIELLDELLIPTVK